MIKTLKPRLRIILTKLLGKDFSSPSLTRLVRDSQVISFDVFDTLIVRPTLAVPSDLFDKLSTTPGFKSARIEAERIARTQSTKEDITLEEIYKVLMPTASDEELRVAIEREINAELKACKANKPALDFFNACKDSGKRIIIISDMYLDCSTISTLLQNCGYNLDGVNVYVSSEYALTKRTGNLFKKVLEIESVSPNEVLHIGDNLRSDWFRPKLMGMKSVLVCHRA